MQVFSHNHTEVFSGAKSGIFPENIVVFVTISYEYVVVVNKKQLCQSTYAIRQSDETYQGEGVWLEWRWKEHTDRITQVIIHKQFLSQIVVWQLNRQFKTILYDVLTVFIY